MNTQSLKQCCDFSINEKEQKQFVRMAKAIGNPVRLSIIKYLATHPGCINANLVNKLPIAQSTTSQHLKILIDAGWVCSSQKGVATHYCLNAKQVVFFRTLVNKIITA